MKKHLVLLSVMLLIQASVISVFAQQKLKAGDLISGVVTDSVSPLMAVYKPLDSRDVRDAAKPPVLIDISEYESLGLYTIDDIFNAKMGLDLP